MHISSLPGKQGIGTIGASAYKFVDFLHESLQSYWQILPICPTSYGDSPYQSYSTFAGNPYFIDLDILCKMGLLETCDYVDIDYETGEDAVNYGALYRLRYTVLKKAAANFNTKDASYNAFLAANKDWINSYALFMSLKDYHQGKSWWEWEEAYRYAYANEIDTFKAEYKDELEFWKIIQYLFFKQWEQLKSYANAKGISIIGDLPIYVSLDSVDVWSDPKQFQLDDERMPKEVSGCPPDGFSKVGQLWGNPLFDWEYMEKDGFSYWLKKISYLCKIYDVLRIDHFRGFDSYYAIPYGSKDATKGVWKPGPGMKLFNKVNEVIGKPRIIVEDLGFLTDSVKKLLKDSGFPGMKVIEMGFDSRDPNSKEYLPHNIIHNSVAYTGSHDNDTIKGWFETAAKEDIEFAKKYMRIRDEQDISWDVIAVLMQSSARLTIVQAQDLLGLGTKARMNTPSTIGENWIWRAKEDMSEAISKRLKEYTLMYERA